MKENDGLLACPFCGGAAILTERHDCGYSLYGRFWWTVACENGCVSFTDREEFYHTDDGRYLLKYPAKECVERWNTRSRPVDAALRSPPECVEALKAAYWFINASEKELFDAGKSRVDYLDTFHRLVPSLESITALPHCPDGFVCVPREPTEAMLDAIADQPYGANAAYEKLIAAAEGN